MREPPPDRWIAPYFREPTLWPVMLVVLAHAVVAIAAVLLDAVRNGGGIALGVAVLLAAASAAALLRDLSHRRFGLTSRALVALWTLGALTAWGADFSGIY